MEIRFAQFCSQLNIGTRNMALIIKELGLLHLVEHEYRLDDIQLNVDQVEKYLVKNNLLEKAIFTPNSSLNFLKQLNISSTYHTLNEIKNKIQEYNAKNAGQQLAFQIGLSQLADLLKLPFTNLTRDLSNLFQELPKYPFIHPATKLPEQIVKLVCEKEGHDFNKITPSSIPYLEGPKIIGKIALSPQKSTTLEQTVPINIDTSNKTEFKPMRLANAATYYNVSMDHLVEELKKNGHKIINNPSAKIAAELIYILDNAYNKDKAIRMQADRTKFIEKTKLQSNITMKSPVQKILFGSPGTGKSWTIENIYLKALDIQAGGENCIKTVFHPEYTYGDFMGKLMPYTNDESQVEYRFYSGHFLKALAQAYKNIVLAYINYKKLREESEKVFKKEIDKSIKKDFTDIEKEELQLRLDQILKPSPQNVTLVIDELNRGNSAAIFGVGFQLLDRDENGWSSYPVRITELEHRELLEEVTLKRITYKKSGIIQKEEYLFDSSPCSESEYKEYRDVIFDDLSSEKKISLHDRNIKLPPNLSIIASMNTSDNSIYFMDSAFKRRWDWEFIDISSPEQRSKQKGRSLSDGFSWQEFVDNLNSFIKDNGAIIRKIEDKQIGYFFIKENVITGESIKNKLQFFLWDSIFSNDKKPLERLLGNKVKLITFGDFVKESERFINAIKAYKQNID